MLRPPATQPTYLVDDVAEQKGASVAEHCLPKSAQQAGRASAWSSSSLVQLPEERAQSSECRTLALLA